MTDHAKLCGQLQEEKSGNYFRRCTLTLLLSLTDSLTGKLPKELYVPEYQVNKEFFLETLTNLGYKYSYIEDYNPFFEQFCYKVTLS